MQCYRCAGKKTIWDDVDAERIECFVCHGKGVVFEEEKVKDHFQEMKEKYDQNNSSNTRSDS